MKKEKFRGTHNEFPLRDDMTMTGAASATDCTGVVQTGSVDSKEEFDRTREIIPHAIPKKPRARGGE